MKLEVELHNECPNSDYRSFIVMKLVIRLYHENFIVMKFFKELHYKIFEEGEASMGPHHMNFHIHMN